MKKTNVKNNKKALLIIGAIVVIVIIAICVRSGGNKKEVVEQNTSSSDAKVLQTTKLSEKKIFKGLEVVNSKFTMEGDMTELSAEVINNTGSDVKEQYININILDKDGNKITSIGGYISPVKNGETTHISASFLTTEETKNSHNIEITEVIEINSGENN